MYTKLSLILKCMIFFLSFRMGSDERLKAVVALGLVSEKPVEKLGSPLNTLSHHLSQLLTFEKGERDMLLMRHDVRIPVD